MGDFYASTPVGPFADSIGAAFTTFTTRQFVDPLPVPVIAPPSLRPGVRVKIEAEGRFSTTVTPTLVIGVAFGTVGATGALATPVVLAESAAITTASGAAAFQWRLEYRGIVTAFGTSGTIVGTGSLEIGTSLTAISSTPIPITDALRTVTINTTIAQGVGIVATWSASSASNSITVFNCTALLQN